MSCKIIRPFNLDFDIVPCHPDIDPICETKCATFSQGCFWGPDSLYGSIKGVMKTKVGYAGGSKPENPTYENIGDYIETVQIRYDPKKITYCDLLQIFWDSHFPAKLSRQYISAIHYHDDEQKSQAQESQNKVRSSGKAAELIPHTKFFDAENYHQKYALRQHEKFLKSLMLNDDEIKNSYSACVLNGFLGGHVSEKEKQRILNVGLSDQQLKYLESCVSS